VNKLIAMGIVALLIDCFTAIAFAQSGAPPESSPENAKQIIFVPTDETTGVQSPGSDDGTVQFNVVVTPSMLPADGKTEAEIIVTLRDKSGNPLGGRTIDFSLVEGYGRLSPTFPVTDDDGIAEAVYVAGRVAATAVVRILDEESRESATVEIPTSISAQISLELVEPSRFISSFIKRQIATQLYTMSVDIFPDKIVADSFSTSRITVTLLNLDGTPAAGVPIEFRVLSGDGEIIKKRNVTDAMGVIEVFYRAGEMPGTAMIEVKEPVTGLAQVAEIMVYEAGPAKIKLFFADKSGALFEDTAQLPADGVSTITVVAQVLNLVDMPVPDVVVYFSLSEELGIIESLEAKTDPSGNVRATFKAGTQTGIETITAFLTSSPTIEPFV